MSWVRLDDKFHSNAKVLAAGNAATGLYVRCCAWSADNGTDGTIPRVVAKSFGTAREIANLISVRMWVEDGDNYRIPDFLDFNFSRAEQEERRAKRAAAGSKGGRKSAERRSNEQANAQALATGSLDACYVQDEANANPVPEPVPEPVASQVTTPPTDFPATGRLGAIADAYSAIAFQRAKNVGNEVTWRKAARDRIITDEELHRLAALFPTAPADAVAAWLHGDKGSMAYYPRVDELAEVVPITRKDEPA